MMKLMSLKQYMKMSKPALIRKIMKTLRKMPKKRLALACYNLTKAKLPALRTIKRKPIESLGKGYGRQIFQAKYLPKRKTKRKFSRKQLAWQKEFGRKAKAGIFSPKVSKRTQKEILVRRRRR